VNLLIAILLATGVAFFGGQAGIQPPAAATEATNEATNEATAVNLPVTVSATVQPMLQKHKVAPGESLSVIAAIHHIDVETLLAANPEVSETIYPGDELVVLPQKGALHIADADDTLWRIAQVYGVSVETIMAANGKQSDQLAVGERVFIPGGRSSQQISRGISARFIWPVNGELTSPFGYRWGRLHAGIDIAADYGTITRAARAGRVIFAGWQGGYGNAVVIEHGQGYSTLYGHLADYLVESGQYVATGQTIGYVGSTGNSSGPHLHFEVRMQGQPYNPLQFLP
jgi:murein DD-endopeptidase MepM/ murein hydrolase activator NlpD